MDFRTLLGRFRHTLVVVYALLALVTWQGLPVSRAAGEGYWHTSGNQILDSNNVCQRYIGVTFL